MIMAEVIQDLGVFNVKDELVFVDEEFCLTLREEEVASIPEDSNKQEGNSSLVRVPIILSQLNSKPDVELINEYPFNRPEESDNKTSSFCNELTIGPKSLSNDKQEEEYDCFKCKKPFKSLEDLACHMDSHEFSQDIEVKFEANGKRKWACKQCDKTFISRKGSVIHLRSHKGERPFGCEVCDKRFIDNSTLMKHQVIHQATRPFICSICHKGFNQKVALQRHKSTHVFQPFFACKFCPKTFFVESSLLAHQNIHARNKPFICRFCPSRFHTVTLQKQHERVHTNERPFQCNSCPKAFKDSGTLFKHQVIHSGIKPFSCPLCSSGFTQKVAVKKHIRTHVLKSGSNSCPVCNICIVDYNELYIHLEKHVLENDQSMSNPFTKQTSHSKIPAVFPELKPDLSDLATLCDVAILTSGQYFLNKSERRLCGEEYCFLCGMQFRHMKTLSSHLKGVHLCCPVCCTKFENKIKLETHTCREINHQFTSPKTESSNGTNKKQKSKLGCKQYTCEKCLKSFTSRNGFVIHQRSHTGERPYACRWCDKAFGDSATRHKHERIHTGERPFKCTTCPKAFNQKAALRAHQVTHSRSRVFLCQICPMSFYYAKTLRKHIEMCHIDTLELPCLLCSKKCCDSSSLITHLRTTHDYDTESKICSCCDSETFSNSDDLANHLVWHAKQHTLDSYVKTKKPKHKTGKDFLYKRVIQGRQCLID